MADHVHQDYIEVLASYNKRLRAVEKQMGIILQSSNVSAEAATTTSYLYTEDTTSTFPNPHRGFFVQNEDWTGSLPTTEPVSYLAAQRAGSVGYYATVRRKILRLDAWETGGSLSAALLDWIDTQCANYRSAGVKVIFRPSYYYNGSGPPYDDATHAIHMAHMAQLYPKFNANKDVIMEVDMGFIGAWGENFFTDTASMKSDAGCNYISVGQSTCSALPLNETLLQYMRDNIDSSIWVSKRIPRWTDQAANSIMPNLTAGQLAGIGNFHDCILAYRTESMIPPSVVAEENHYETWTIDHLSTGETCSNSSYGYCVSAGGNAETYMSRFHFTALNGLFKEDLMANWQAQGCFDVIDRLLGYRLVMTTGEYQDVARPGYSMTFDFTMKNEGYAAVMYGAVAEAVLVNKVGGAVWRADITGTADPQSYVADNEGSTPTNYSMTLGIPASMPVGTYDLYLNFRDPDATLGTDPNYSIRFANTDVSWSGTTGFNDTNHDVVISASGPVTVASGSADHLFVAD